MEAKTKVEEVRPTDPPDTIELVARCGNGDPAALEEFFGRYAEDMYNFPMKVFHLDSDAASDFFLYAFERLREGNRFGSFQGRSSFRTWFYTVLRNLVIDWMRTIREVQTVNPTRTDSSGRETTVIENTPDTRGEGHDPDLLERFRLSVDSLTVEQRTLFKLSYIYYLELAPDEVEFLVAKSGRSTTELVAFLADLKAELADKELRNLDYEDKITSLYMSILDLKNRRDRLQTESNVEIDEVTAQFELEKVERAISKKYEQRRKLLEKREKGHFIVRTPYRFLTELLGMPEGSVSVQMMRAVERIRQASPPLSEEDHD